MRLEVPAGARVLSFGMQATPVFWAEVDPGAFTVSRRFQILPTGASVPDGWEWRGTVQEGPFVWHVYEQM